MFSTDIVVVDSGINIDLCVDQKEEICGLHVFDSGKSIQIDDDIQDRYGHGSAVINIIKKHSDAKIFVVKIFEGEDYVNEKNLLYALKYIRDNIKCKIINLSMGLKICERKKELEEICKELYDNAVIIISAFDNDGCFSFPAAFDCVIGVGNSYKCKTPFQFEYVEGSPINILAKGGLQRVRWNDRSIVIGGCSFASAYVTAYVANLIKDQPLSYIQVLEELRRVSIKVYEYKEIARNTDDFFEIDKAALFHINKEMHSLLRNFDNLHFTIVDIYDIKQSGRVGANINKIINSIDKEINCIIKDIKTLDFRSIDTLIIGHMDEINRLLGKDVRLMLIEAAIENNINIFSFDPLEYCVEQIRQRRSHVYYPIITMADVPQNTFGKLYVINKPIVSVFGTSSQQGKFTLQLILRDLLVHKDYKVGMLGTEPHSLLFGMDHVYPMGYKASLNIDGHSSVVLLNTMLYNICEKDVEIIITGSQANTVPLNSYNAMAFPIKQHAFLMGVQPDVVVLCINPQDDIQYIVNTIKYIEGTANCKVIGMVLFPMKLTNDWRNVFDVKEKIEPYQIQRIRTELETKLQIPLFVLGEMSEMSDLSDLIIDYLSEGDDDGQ